MTKALYKTTSMFESLVKRDWIKLIIWVFGMLAFAASGAGKMEVASSPATASTLYAMFVQNPAMVALFGPTLIKNAAHYTIGPIYGQTMTLITAITFAIISIIYVINRTRKEEDDGIAELFRSFPIGKLANTTAVVIELVLLHIVMTLVLAFSIQAQNVTGLNDLGSNLLFASTTSAQGFMWGMIALCLAQIFPESGSAKGATFGLLGLLYIVRMGTDVSHSHLGWLNPLSWSYLASPYALGHENWLGVLLSLVFAVIVLAAAYLLEIKRDVNAGYLPESGGRIHAKAFLLSLPGLLLTLQRKMIIGWFLAVFVLGLVYGSMFSQMSRFINSNATIRAIFIGSATAHQAIVGNFMVTLFSILSIMVAAFAVILLTQMTAEERKNRQEQLYALPISRIKLYLTYIITTIFASAIAQFLAILGIYLEQLGNKNALTFSQVLEPGTIWIVAIIFVISLLSLLVSFVPRLTGIIWGYMGFLLFMSYLGHILALPGWLQKLSIYNYIPKLPIEKMDWTTVSIILVLSVAMMIIALVAYRRRDLING
ncbi:ABC transporter permease [Oenococcus sicerae]|uniref:ABC transporter permease n=1 Tax=Oenococcus sicerae TaxID=2203724 RepID=A0AAJ1VNQ6_9LACO|nr:ABC transporter permease [Oenococcus sicerae]MDN6900996.1 ABC transporter permease [Oenococcus sicerae]